MAWDMCTCAVRANLLMEREALFRDLPQLGGLYHYAFGVLFASVADKQSGLIRCVWVWENITLAHAHTHCLFSLILLLLPLFFTHGQSLWAHLCSPRFIICLTEGLAEGIWTPHKLSCRLQCDADQFHSPGSLAHNLRASPITSPFAEPSRNRAAQLTA